jgi:hypothetical protein
MGAKSCRLNPLSSGPTNQTPTGTRELGGLWGRGGHRTSLCTFVVYHVDSLVQSKPRVSILVVTRPADVASVTALDPHWGGGTRQKLVRDPRSNFIEIILHA